MLRFSTTRFVLATTIAFALAGPLSEPLHALDVPSLKAHVNDHAGLLRPDEAIALEQTLSAYAQKTGHQFALLTVPTLNGEVIEDFSIRVAEQWKLGDARRNDGLIFIIAANDRKLRIEVGYGLEGAIPDALAGRIIQDRVRPLFRQGHYAAGIQSAFQALMHAAEGESIGAAPVQRGNQDLGWGFIFFLVMLTAILVQRLPTPARMGVTGTAGAAAGLLVANALPWILGGAAIGLCLGWLMRAGPAHPLGGIRSGWGGGFGGFGRGGGGWSSGGGFSGGGGSFGGGGASGDW